MEEACNAALFYRKGVSYHLYYLYYILHFICKLSVKTIDRLFCFVVSCIYKIFKNLGDRLLKLSSVYVLVLDLYPT